MTARPTFQQGSHGEHDEVASRRTDAVFLIMVIHYQRREATEEMRVMVDGWQSHSTAPGLDGISTWSNCAIEDGGGTLYLALEYFAVKD